MSKIVKIFKKKLSKCWSCHVSSSLWSNVSKVTVLLGRYLYVKNKSTLSEWMSQWPSDPLSCSGQLKMTHWFWAGLVGSVIRYMVGGVCLKGSWWELLTLWGRRQGQRVKVDKEAWEQNHLIHLNVVFNEVNTNSTIESIEKESLTGIWSVKH